MQKRLVRYPIVDGIVPIKSMEPVIQKEVCVSCKKQKSMVPAMLLPSKSSLLSPVRYPMVDGIVPANVILKDMGVSSPNKN